MVGKFHDPVQLKLEAIRVQQSNTKFIKNPKMMVIHSGTSNITNNVNTLQKIRNVINAIKENTAQKNVPCSKFSIQDLVTFTEEILNRKVHFLCSEMK